MLRRPGARSAPPSRRRPTCASPSTPSWQCSCCAAPPGRRRSLARLREPQLRGLGVAMPATRLRCSELSLRLSSRPPPSLRAVRSSGSSLFA